MALAAPGEGGERQQLVLSQLQRETAVAVEELEKEASCSRTAIQKRKLKRQPHSSLSELPDHWLRAHPVLRPSEYFRSYVKDFIKLYFTERIFKESHYMEERRTR